MKKMIVVLSALLLTACSTYTPQRYSISADNNLMLKTISAGNINVGDFQGPKKF